MYNDNFNDNFSKTAESNKETVTLKNSETVVETPSLTLKFQKTHPDAVIPTYAHDSDAGMDIYAVEDVKIKPGETVLIHTGLKAQIPEGFELQVRPRSGMSLKTKLRIANAPGTIDAGYRDEICVIAENTDIGYWKESSHVSGYAPKVEYKTETFVKGNDIIIHKGDRIAQFVFSILTKIKIEEVKEVSKEGDRGGGFGSTDKSKPNCKACLDFDQADEKFEKCNECIRGDSI